MVGQIKVTHVIIVIIHVLYAYVVYIVVYIENLFKFVYVFQI